jgi:integrase
MRRQGSARRRIAVKGHPAIYYRVGAGGKRHYEITYVDSDGRRRWQVVPGNLGNAEAALGEVKRRRRRGERVAPSRARVEEIAPQWLDMQAQLRPATRGTYDWALKKHIIPFMGRLRISEVTTDHVADLIIEMREKGCSPATIRAALTPLSRLMAWAARRGMRAGNPVAGLERGERPAGGGREMRILQRAEIPRLLDATDERHRALLATAIFTGLRQGELLGLLWRDLDLDAGVLHVRRQLDRWGNLVEPETRQAKRQIVLMPALGSALRQHRLRSPYSGDEDFVFVSEVGTAMSHRNVVTRGLDPAVRRAGLEGPHLRFHDLRHTFASILIAAGQDIVFVSRQLGHARPSVTLGTYAHLFDHEAHGRRLADALEAGFGGVFDEAQSAPEVIALAASR